MIPAAALFTLIPAAGSLPDPSGKVTLIPTRQTLQAGKPYTVVLQFSPDAGCHTYWTNPGDSGGPPVVTWNLDKGWKVESVKWPTPERLDFAGVVCYGYDKPAPVLVTLMPPANLPTGKVALKGSASWMVCTPQLCAPVKSKFQGDLPVGGAAQASASVNQTKYPSPLKGWIAEASKTGSSIVLKLANGKSIKGAAGAYFFPGATGLVEHGAAQSFTPTNDGLEAKLQVSEYAKPHLGRLKGVLKAPNGQTWDGVHNAFWIDTPVTERS